MGCQWWARFTSSRFPKTFSHVFHTFLIDNVPCRLDMFVVSSPRRLDICSSHPILGQSVASLTLVSTYNPSSQLLQESGDELIRDFQRIVNSAPHRGPAVAIIHQP